MVISPMYRKIYYIFITTFFAVAAAGCGSTSEAEAELQRDTARAEIYIRQAEELFRGRESLDRLREALATLKRARAADERNFEAAWKFAQYSYFLGKATPADAESAQVFEAGINAATIATRIEPEKPDGYFWLGANYGGEAERSPLTKGFTAVGKIREAMQKVIELDPAYQGATAFDALAVVELKTSFYGGKPEKAVEYLEQGLKLNPKNFLARLHLAEAYLSLDRDAEAKSQLEQVLEIEPPDDLRPEYAEVEKDARKLLARRF